MLVMGISWSGLISKGVAGELLEHATKAEQALADNKPVQSLAEMEAAFNKAWDIAPLGFSEALFVAKQPVGFGLYEPRATSTFKPGEPLIVYAEPFGYGFIEQGGQFGISLIADFDVKTKKGLVLQEQKAFATPATVSRRRNKEFEISFSFALNGLRPGDYLLDLKLTDKASAKVGTFTLPFTIVRETRS